MYKYNFAVCGGTFDLLHEGHRKFLKEVINSSNKVLLGITSDEYTNNNKKNSNIEKFVIRKKNIKSFLASINAITRVKIVKINSAYDPYLEIDRKYDVIFVTPNTKKAALEINKKRLENKTPPLIINILGMNLASDNKEISSTRIRNGEINREGMLYVNPKWSLKNLVLAKNLRIKLQVPWGRVIKNLPKNLDDKNTIVVGDACTLFFNKKNRNQFLSIVDFLVKREVKFKNLSELGFKNKKAVKINNHPGTISSDLFKAVVDIFKTKKTTNVILINGEDDLAVLPVILIAPLGFNIFYGQPNIGMVYLKITDEIKDKAYNLVNKFLLE